MADFLTADKPLAIAEGGFANDKSDRGGMTIFGLTRRDWPQWHGWITVDHLISTLGLSKAIPAINSNQQLKDSATDLFKANYWKPLSLDLVHDQQIANQVFDCAINMGVGTSARFLQIAANVSVDLHVGPKTISAINSNDPETLYNVFITLRKGKYDKIIIEDPTQAKFKKSWYSRLIPYSPIG